MLIYAHICSFMFISHSKNLYLCSLMCIYDRFCSFAYFNIPTLVKPYNTWLFCVYTGGTIKLHTKCPTYNTHTYINVLKSILSPKLPLLRHETLLRSPNSHPHTTTRLKTAILGSTISFSAFWLLDFEAKPKKS